MKSRSVFSQMTTYRVRQLSPPLLGTLSCCLHSAAASAGGAEHTPAAAVVWAR